MCCFQDESSVIVNSPHKGNLTSESPCTLLPLDLETPTAGLS